MCLSRGRLIRLNGPATFIQPIRAPLPFPTSHTRAGPSPSLPHLPRTQALLWTPPPSTVGSAGRHLFQSFTGFQVLLFLLLFVSPCPQLPSPCCSSPSRWVVCPYSSDPVPTAPSLRRSNPSKQGHRAKLRRTKCCCHQVKMSQSSSSSAGKYCSFVLHPVAGLPLMASYSVDEGDRQAQEDEFLFLEKFSKE
jgi:hypothetical protein